MFDPDEIKHLIETHLPCQHVYVEGNDGVHFSAIVVSAEFVGLGLVAQHQKVYAALGERLVGDIHALQLQTFTPGKWAASGLAE